MKALAVNNSCHMKKRRHKYVHKRAAIYFLLRPDWTWWTKVPMFPFLRWKKKVSLVITSVGHLPRQAFFFIINKHRGAVLSYCRPRSLSRHHSLQIINTLCQECCEKSIHCISIYENSAFYRLAVRMIDCSRHIYWDFFSWTEQLIDYVKNKKYGTVFTVFVYAVQCERTLMLVSLHSNHVRLVMRGL